ncbi:type II toxin-antitoxin system VapB family antitoxin [Limnobacter sp.]|uniref:type II toxin-antitoxin system VapB family antitoxin n=1 Tax=Limnobacter sp. TaxID=2003368 RepID=UPI003517426A
MAKSTVFTSSRSQAVRIPKALALPADVKVVEVVAVGRTRIISPAGEAWVAWFEGPSVTDDFMQDRDQPGMQDRESF